MEEITRQLGEQPDNKALSSVLKVGTLSLLVQRGTHTVDIYVAIKANVLSRHQF